MPRDIPIGNGRLLAAFDADYRIRDFYYPRVGKENHALGYPWRLGVWIDGEFSWIEKSAWDIHLGYVADSLVTQVALSHPRFPVRIAFNDLVDHEKNILIRRARVVNLSGRSINFRLFLHTDLNVLENEIGDTVFYDPKNAAIVHYKGPRYFLMSCATPSQMGVVNYSTGKKRQAGHEGTWKDAEDGALGGNPVTQGAVDSVIGLYFTLRAHEEAVAHYWLAAGRNYSEVDALNRFVLQSDPDQLIERNIDYWNCWLNCRESPGLQFVPPELKQLYKRSLLILRTNIDEGGAIIAANDSDIWQFNLDTYSYMWPRDGAIVAQTLDRAGYYRLSHRFLEFCTKNAVEFNFSASILAESGFLMHKYNPDASVGSSWHPWISGDEMQFPIQEDETALVLWTIWNHYELRRDIEDIQPLYSPFVTHAADFLLAFRNEQTGLPLPSYDLWEENRGVFTFTTAAVIAGLIAAAKLAYLFHDNDRAQRYRRGADDIKQAMDRHLYNAATGCFARGIVFQNGVQRREDVADASLMGLVLFGVYDAADPRIVRTMKLVENTLWVPGEIGGLARYRGDTYQRAAGVDGRVPGNPWIICTLWLAQHKIALAKTPSELELALDLLQWSAKRALPSGVLPEQVHPESGEFLSVAPLTWSHATFAAAALDYAQQAQRLNERIPQPKAVFSARADRIGGVI
jgi:GH15 family glucan-1,4-alpha-glucosidase